MSASRWRDLSLAFSAIVPEPARSGASSKKKRIMKWFGLKFPGIDVPHWLRHLPERWPDADARFTPDDLSSRTNRDA